MAERIEEDVATIPAASSSFSGEFTFSSPSGDVERIDVRIPNGHAGKTGLAVFYAGTQIIPKRADQWIKGNNETRSFNLDDFPTGDTWGWVGYNNGTKAHSFRVYFHVNEIGADVTPLPPVVLLPYAP